MNGSIEGEIVLTNLNRFINFNRSANACEASSIRPAARVVGRDFRTHITFGGHNAQKALTPLRRARRDARHAWRFELPAGVGSSDGLLGVSACVYTGTARLRRFGSGGL